MNRARGFTLIELAIVLVIITILVGGLAAPLSAQVQARRIAETRQTLEEARATILGYAMTHPAAAPGKRHLPCPDTDGDGRENRSPVTESCDSPAGLLPWVDLGTAPQDAWGNRLRYEVNSQFADKGTGFSASTPLNNPIGICSVHTCATPDVAENVVFVLVSHGPNGWGAQNVNNPPGALLAAPNGPDEADNLDDADRIYVSRSATQSDATSGEFDDLVTWIAHSQLVPRVCPPGSDCSP